MTSPFLHSLTSECGGHWTPSVIPRTQITTQILWSGLPIQWTEMRVKNRKYIVSCYSLSFLIPRQWRQLSASTLLICIIWHSSLLFPRACYATLVISGFLSTLEHVTNPVVWLCSTYLVWTASFMTSKAFSFHRLGRSGSRICSYCLAINASVLQSLASISSNMKQRCMAQQHPTDRLVGCFIR